MALVVELNTCANGWSQSGVSAPAQKRDSPRTHLQAQGFHVDIEEDGAASLRGSHRSWLKQYSPVSKLHRPLFAQQSGQRVCCASQQ